MRHVRNQGGVKKPFAPIQGVNYLIISHWWRYPISKFECCTSDIFPDFWGIWTRLLVRTLLHSMLNPTSLSLGNGLDYQVSIIVESQFDWWKKKRRWLFFLLKICTLKNGFKWFLFLTVREISQWNINVII